MATGLLGTEVIPQNPLLNPRNLIKNIRVPGLGFAGAAPAAGLLTALYPSSGAGAEELAWEAANMKRMMSAQDVINSHLSQENNYKTWDFGYTNQMSETEARNRGIIIPPDPTVTAEERKRNLTLPNIPPEMEQGWVEDFPIEESKPTILSTPVLEPGEQGSIETLPFEKPDIGSMILHTEGLLKDEKVTSGILDETAPPFYSKIKKTIEDAKMEKGSAEQWKGYINNAGVNQEELDWIGLKDYLADRKSVTKEDVLNFVEMNDLAVQVKDIVLGAESDAIRFTGDTMEMIEGQGTTLTWDSRVPEVLRNAAGYQDAKDIVMNDEGLYDQYQEYLFETEQQTADDPITYFLQDEFGMFRGSSDQGKTMFNTPKLITEGDYTDYKEMVFQLPKNEWKIRDLENEIKDLQKEKNLLSDIRSETGAIKDEKKWHELSDQQDKLMDAIEQLEKSTYAQGHYKKYPNTFAHARFNTRDVDGKKTLFIEELQSDWIRKGRDEGFKNDKEYSQLREEQQKLFEIQSKIEKEIKEQGFDGTEKQKEEYFEAKDRYDEIENILIKSHNNAVPDIPFKKNWQDIVLKRLIRYASENGFDAIAMTGGSIQADRYDLSKQIESLKVQKFTFLKDLFLTEGEAKQGYRIQIIKNNEIIESKKIYEDKLGDFIGKEMADKIIKSEKIKKGGSQTFEGLDLKVGGEGLKSMYDKIFSKSLNKIGKKFDAKAELKNLDDFQDKGYTFETPEEAYDFVTGDEFLNDQFMDYLKMAKRTTWDYVENTNQVEKNAYIREFLREQGQDLELKLKTKDNQSDMWFMNITPSMKKKAIEAGFPIAYNKPVNPLFQFA